MKKLLKVETMAAEKSLVLRERALAELDKVGAEQRGGPMFLLLDA